MNITSGYISYCIEWSAATERWSFSAALAGRVWEGGSDTPIRYYNIPPVTYRQNKKPFLYSHETSERFWKSILESRPDFSKKFKKESRRDSYRKNKNGLPCA